MLCVVIRAAERAAEWSCAVKCGHSREILFRTGFCLDTGKPRLGGGRQEGAGRGELRQWSLRCSPLYLIKYLSLSVSLSFLPLFSQAAAWRGWVQSTQQHQPSARCPHDIYTILFIHQARWSVDIPGTGIPTI